MPTTALDIDSVFIKDAETTVVGPAGASEEYNIPVIRFTNNDTIEHFLTVNVYKSGGAGDLNVEAKDLTIQPKSTFEYGPLVLGQGRKVTAKADVADKINASVHGWRKTP